MQPREQALSIRLFEQGLLKLYSQGHLYGTVHTCVGQEMVGVAAAQAFQEGDLFCSNHRGHGHFLALTGDQRGLLAEVLGREEGVCKGFGGTQHLYHPKGFYSNGIQGGMAPVATGLALAARLFKTGSMVFLFVGDGTLGEGALYESLNIASKWDLPLMVLVVNNGIAQTTPVETALAGTVAGRAEAFGIDYRRGDTWQWEELIKGVGKAAAQVRQSSRPLLFEIETARLNSHSKGDDTRSVEMVEGLWERDPVESWLKSDPEAAKLQTRLSQELEELTAQVLELPLARATQPEPARTEWCPPQDRPRARIVEEVNQALSELMAADERVVLLGEDMQSPYGGAFKVSQGLSDRFPERVLSTPISEAAIVGVGTGLALGGGRPIVEIMFGDFLGLAFDQILNHAAKFSRMFGGRVSVPLMIRTPMGGYRGYGPTHSQSLEKHLLGIPDLQVVAPNSRICNASFYRGLARALDRPVLVVENKLLYTRFNDRELPPGYEVEVEGDSCPTLRLSPRGKKADLTFLCYGGMLEMVEEAVLELFDGHDLLAEIVCPTRLHPFTPDSLERSVRTTRALVVVEEGFSFAGFGAEAVTRLAEQGALPRAIARVGARDFVPAARSAETEVLPSVKQIVQAAVGLLSVPRR